MNSSSQVAAAHNVVAMVTSSPPMSYNFQKRNMELLVDVNSDGGSVGLGCGYGRDRKGLGMG